MSNAKGFGIWGARVAFYIACQTIAVSIAGLADSGCMTGTDQEMQEWAVSWNKFLHTLDNFGARLGVAPYAQEKTDE